PPARRGPPTTCSASPAPSSVITSAPVEGAARRRRPFVSTMANPPAVIDRGVSSDPGGRDRQLETLPWTSPARTRKAYRCPFDPAKMALVLVTPVSQPFQAPPS